MLHSKDNIIATFQMDKDETTKTLRVRKDSGNKMSA